MFALPFTLIPKYLFICKLDLSVMKILMNAMAGLDFTQTNYKLIKIEVNLRNKS